MQSSHLYLIAALVIIGALLVTCFVWIFRKAKKSDTNVERYQGKYGKRKAGGNIVYDPDRALELLRLGTKNPKAQFHENQEDAIRHIVNGDGRLLVVQKTGWGKSLVYFIATKLLREAGLGPALLISPLLALMRNQIAAAERLGVRAETINSANKDEWDEIEESVKREAVDILLISPERLANQKFLERVQNVIAPRVSLLVIDEAHCISDWGHDFRPHYRLIERTIRELPSNLRLLATTATANKRVMDDLRNILGKVLTDFRGNLNRPSLTLQTLRLNSQAERLAWIAQSLEEIQGNGIIYALTIRDAHIVASWLRSRGFNVKAYTGQTEKEERPKLEQELLENKVKALVSTSALGMGFDKPDLAFVIHYQAPGSVVAYYQQVGRAGRALENAHGILLSGPEELEIHAYFIESAFPTEDEVNQVLDTLSKSEEGLSLWQLCRQLNIKQERIEKTLQLLSLESPAPVVKVSTKWQLTAATLGQGFWERVERLTTLRQKELEEMQRYVDLSDGHMDFLIQALDGEPVENSGSSLEPLEIVLDPQIVQEAIDFLKGSFSTIKPRKKWPAGGMPIIGVSGIIPEDERNEEGRALSKWVHAGWSESVKIGKYEGNHYHDELVAACEKMIAEWGVVLNWVSYGPSLGKPELVKDFARRLAQKLGLDCIESLVDVDKDRPPQKEMQNSPQQALNMDGAFVIAPNVEFPKGPVLLVDDIVDSGWTLTVAGYLLRADRVESVVPMALATLRG
jgi:ATP-dependent DNA helicase RecQ